MSAPKNLRYRESHEWAKKEGEFITCGITDYAQQELSDVVFVELPEVGRVVTSGQTLCVVESVKAASDIYAPISGKVVAVNESLGQAPQTINEDPYGGGWICKIKPSNEQDWNGLLTAEAYEKQISGV